MVSRPPRGRYLAKSLQNRGKNEVRPGAWHHRLLLLAQCDVVSVSVGVSLEQAYLSEREA